MRVSYRQEDEYTEITSTCTTTTNNVDEGGNHCIHFLHSREGNMSEPIYQTK